MLLMQSALGCIPRTIMTSKQNESSDSLNNERHSPSVQRRASALYDQEKPTNKIGTHVTENGNDKLFDS